MNRTNSSPGQYLVVDQNLNQRFLLNNQNSSKIYPFLPGNQASLNLLPPTNSNHLFNTNQLNSNLNGNANGLNTQTDRTKMNFPHQLVNSNPPNPAFFQNLQGVNIQTVD